MPSADGSGNEGPRHRHRVPPPESRAIAWIYGYSTKSERANRRGGLRFPTALSRFGAPFVQLMITHPVAPHGMAVSAVKERSGAAMHYNFQHIRLLL